MNRPKQIGQYHPCAKLRNADIPRIRSKLRDGVPMFRLAREHGVDWTTIRQIRDGLTWKSVPE